MTLVIHCPHCSGKASCDDSELGQDAPCPHCGQIFTLVSPAQAAKAAKAPPPQIQVQAAASSTQPKAATPAAPAPASFVQGVRKARETRAEFVSRIRKESSYAALRGVLIIVRNIAYAVALLSLLGSLTGGFMTGGFGQAIIGAASSVLLAALASAAYQAGIVLVDIADTLIDERVNP